MRRSDASRSSHEYLLTASVCGLSFAKILSAGAIKDSTGYLRYDAIMLRALKLCIRLSLYHLLFPLCLSDNQRFKLDYRADKTTMCSKRFEGHISGIFLLRGMLRTTIQSSPDARFCLIGRKLRSPHNRSEEQVVARVAFDTINQLGKRVSSEALAI